MFTFSRVPAVRPLKGTVDEDTELDPPEPRTVSGTATRSESPRM